MYYQFQLDGRRAGPVRDKWADAAKDAVSAGYAVFTGPEKIRLDDQAAIARHNERPQANEPPRRGAQRPR